MFEKPAVIFIIIATSIFQTAGQGDKRVQRKDSITVSAGISKEQLALEDQLNEIISQGDAALRQGNAAVAVLQYQKAVELAQNQTLLEEKKNYTLGKLAKGYVQANRAADAIPIYSQLLVDKKEDCEAQTPAVSNCADARFNLGMAQLHAHDFEAALLTLRQAERNYAMAEKLSGDTHEFALIQAKDQAQTNLWIAVTLFQLGKSQEAATIVESAIAQLGRVQSDPDILEGIRDDAVRSLRDAQGFLKRLKEQ
jgi:tetratricopeptide (TPR) repeat protein